MIIKYFKYTVLNDKNNNIYLFCHKISQFIKYNISEDFGIYSDVDNNRVEIKIENKINTLELSKFLNREIKEIEESIEINEGDSFIVEVAFKNNHVKNILDKTKINMDDISKLGYIPNTKIIDNTLCHYINQKKILSLYSENIQINNFESIKLEYNHLEELRRMSLNKQVFLMQNCKIIDFEDMKKALICGLGVKKSYGLSNLIKI